MRSHLSFWHADAPLSRSLNRSSRLLSSSLGCQQAAQTASRRKNLYNIFRLQIYSMERLRLLEWCWWWWCWDEEKKRKTTAKEGERWEPSNIILERLHLSCTNLNLDFIIVKFAPSFAHWRVDGLPNPTTCDEALASHRAWKHDCAHGGSSGDGGRGGLLAMMELWDPRKNP